VLPMVLHRLRAWDRLAADRVDRFIAISRTVQTRIEKYYRRESSIIYPPVDVGEPPDDIEPEDYYLIVSRLVPYKRVDLAVAAFNELGLPLRIVGAGRDRKALEDMAGPNIRFLGYVNDEAKRELTARCRALLFPGEEDFGIAPLEAMAAGRPVIAYGSGGALDTIIEDQTGLFFREPTADALADAVRRMETMRFDPTLLRAHAERFAVPRFQRELDEALTKARNARRR
jgi:glycosyltransferase involved in cell wall biosynthesis